MLVVDASSSVPRRNERSLAINRPCVSTCVFSLLLAQRLMRFSFPIRRGRLARLEKVGRAAVHIDIQGRRDGKFTILAVIFVPAKYPKVRVEKKSTKEWHRRKPYLRKPPDEEQALTLKWRCCCCWGCYHRSGRRRRQATRLSREIENRPALKRFHLQPPRIEQQKRERRGMTMLLFNVQAM